MRVLVLAATAFVVGCAPTGLRLGSKADKEGVILAEMAGGLLRDAGLPVDLRHRLGGTPVLWEALLVGEIDAYPEYTGTLRLQILRGKSVDTDEKLRTELAAHGLAMTKSLGFANNYALGVRQADAEAKGLRTISDLRRHPQLSMAFSFEFTNRADGWPGLRDRYALPHTDTRGMDHQLAYEALAAGRVAVTDLYTTDAEIERFRLLALDDDLKYFPSYDAVILYRSDLEGRYPGASAALVRLEGKVDNARMVSLNGRAQDGVPEARVASEFLAADLGVRDKRGDEGPAAYILRLTLEHLRLVVISLLAAVAVAVPLGVLAAYRRRFGQVVLTLTGIVQTIPSLVLLVFMIPLPIIGGIGERPAIVALFLYSLLPIVRNTHAGLSDIPKSLRESAEALGLGFWARLRLVELPLAARPILAGIKTAAVINVGTATLGAFIGAGGLGQAIQTGIQLHDTSLILQGAIPAALLALAVQGVFELVERAVTPRG